MTFRTLQAPTPALALAAGMELRLEAISTTTGDPVTGVTSSAWAIYGVDESDLAAVKFVELPPALAYKGAK